MTREQLVEYVKNEITLSGSFPFLITEKEIERLIEREKEWFYINYIRATEPFYYVIREHYFGTKEFREQRRIMLPDCVWSVAQVREIKNAYRLGGPLKSFGLDRMVAAELYLAGPNTLGENLISMTARMQFLDLTKSFFLQDVSFQWNPATKALSITGRTPNADIAVKAYNKIEDHALFDDYYFKRVVVARSKQSTATLLGMADYTMPGGVKINKDQFQSQGDQELEKTIQEMRDMQPVDYFIMFN